MDQSIFAALYERLADPESCVARSPASFCPSSTYESRAQSMLDLSVLSADAAGVHQAVVSPLSGTEPSARHEKPWPYPKVDPKLLHIRGMSQAINLQRDQFSGWENVLAPGQPGTELQEEDVDGQHSKKEKQQVGLSRTTFFFLWTTAHPAPNSPNLCTRLQPCFVPKADGSTLVSA